MCTRIYSLALLLLAGCGRPAEAPANTQGAAQVNAEQKRVAGDERVLCAHAGQPMRRSCTVEQLHDGEGMLLTLRHADGGFRRLRVAADGRGVVAADGAEMAKVTVLGPDGIEVMLGGDRYRLPATVKSGARAS